MSRREYRMLSVYGSRRPGASHFLTAPDSFFAQKERRAYALRNKGWNILPKVVDRTVPLTPANGTLMSALQRLFYSTSFDKSLKVGASVVSARRSGCTTTFDELNKFFTLCNMPVATSQYWNNIYGWEPGEGEVDAEGRQVMRTLARNMAFLMKSIALGKKKNGAPLPEEPRVWTNFTR